jgi:hypothetical protein
MESVLQWDQDLVTVPSATFICFLFMNFVLRMRCFSVYSALCLSFLYVVKRNTIVTRLFRRTVL